MGKTCAGEYFEVTLPMKQGCSFRAEIIPCEPDADNADEGSFLFAKNLLTICDPPSGTIAFLFGIKEKHL